MEEPTQGPDFFQELGRELRQTWHLIKDGWHHSGISIRNGLRRLRLAKIDYVVMTISGPLPERAEPPRSFIERQLRLPPPPFSIQALNYRLRRVMDADNVKGVVFILENLGSGLATTQSVRQSILRLRESGKTAVVYTPYLDMAHYYIATAADKIVIPPGAPFNVLGMRSEAIFLKDALARAGLHFDAVQISPYKTAPNMFTRSEISPEQEEQMTWLLDEIFDIFTESMADGRQMTTAEFQHLIDSAPIFARDALAAGLVDAIAYEDELPYLLAEPAAEAEGETEENGDEIIETTAVSPAAVDSVADTAGETETDQSEKEAEKAKAKLSLWQECAHLLLEKPRRSTSKFIGVISLTGAITMGQSQRPPVDLPIPLIGGQTAGEATLLALLRQAEKLEKMAALILHVDSPGGDALASDLIAREIQRLNQKKPVVIYMGNVAASGGYYVSALGSHIMSQSMTITGSIGVLMLRVSPSGLFDKLSINQTGIERGKNAGLYSRPTPLSDDELQILQNGIIDIYRQFKEVVANGRDLPYDELDPICEGRVWSGRQACRHKLVDNHGDFIDAVQKAAELGDLPIDDEHKIRVVNLHLKQQRHVLPQPFAAVDEVSRLLSGERLAGWQGRPLYLMPYQINIK